MNDTPTTQTRLDELEAHVAHQDHVIEELSDVTAKQWAEISDLNEKLERLKSKFQDLESGTEAPAGDEPPPPHY